jgi:hypothetical protein
MSKVRCFVQGVRDVIKCSNSNQVILLLTLNDLMNWPICYTLLRVIDNFFKDFTLNRDFDILQDGLISMS